MYSRRAKQLNAWTNWRWLRWELGYITENHSDSVEALFFYFRQFIAVMENAITLWRSRLTSVSNFISCSDRLEEDRHLSGPGPLGFITSPLLSQYECWTWSTWTLQMAIWFMSALDQYDNKVINKWINISTGEEEYICDLSMCLCFKNTIIGCFELIYFKTKPNRNLNSTVKRMP